MNQSPIQQVRPHQRDSNSDVRNVDSQGQLYPEEDALDYMVTIPEFDDNNVIKFGNFEFQKNLIFLNYNILKFSESRL